MRPDLFVHRLIERLGLRRQQLFSAQAEVVERLRGLARFGELATAFTQRRPQATPREFARSIAAAAEAGLREQEEPTPIATRGVQVLAMDAAPGLEFDHVYVLGLHAAGMPGAHTRTLEPIDPALLKETLSQDDDAAHVAEMRRLLHVAMTRTRGRLVLVHPQASERGAAQPPSPFAEEARLSGRRPLGGARRGAVRPGRVAPLDLPDPARRAAGDDQADRRADRRAALRHRPRRLARDRPLPRGRQAGGADRALPRGSRCRTRSPRSTRDSPRRSRASSATSCSPRRSTSGCSTPTATTDAARPRSPRARSRRWSRSCRAAATA